MLRDEGAGVIQDHKAVAKAMFGVWLRLGPVTNMWSESSDLGIQDRRRANQEQAVVCLCVAALGPEVLEAFTVLVRNYERRL